MKKAMPEPDPEQVRKSEEFAHSYQARMIESDPEEWLGKGKFPKQDPIRKIEIIENAEGGGLMDVVVTKQFTPEHGGGTQRFTMFKVGKGWREALETAKGLIENRWDGEWLLSTVLPNGRTNTTKNNDITAVEDVDDLPKV